MFTPGSTCGEHGVAAVPQRLVTYASVEVHSCVQKAIESLGLGASSLRKVPVERRVRDRRRGTGAMMAADRAAGEKPFCVIGNAATINTGATDDLEALATLCEREQLWFHVDGAIGALLALAPRHRHLVRGMERADSVTLDLHKWLHVPFEAACALVRDRKAHRETFALTPEYLEHTERGLASGITLVQRIRTATVARLSRAESLALDQGTRSRQVRAA